MMTTDSTSTGLSGLLPQILGGLDEASVLNASESGEFVQSLAAQIKSLMLQRGDDPSEVAAIDDESLAAQFFALVQERILSPETGLSVTGDLGEVLDETQDESTEAPSATETTNGLGFALPPTVILERLNEAGRVLPSVAGSSAGLDSNGASTADLTTLTSALLKQAGATNADDAGSLDQSDVMETSESTTTLPGWLARQLSGGASGAWTETPVSMMSSVRSEQASITLDEILPASSTLREGALESLSSVQVENSLETGDLTASTATGATRATETSTIGGRLQTLDLNRLLQPGGEQRLADQVRWSVEQGLETAEIKLHPPSLGALDVRVVQEGDKTHVQFVSAHPVAREVLDAAIPRLREALAQDGVLLGNVTVSDQAPNDRGETGRERGSGSAGTGESEIEDETDPVELHGTISMLSRRLDVFT